jgi:DNA polymerase elongation subunit (family B)
MKILIIDIETRPNLAWCWGLFDQNISLNQIERVGSVISWAAKWHGDREIMFSSDFHDSHENCIKEAWNLLDEADVVVGYNSKSFDMKHLAREFILADLPPPSHYVDIDLLSVVRQRFKFISNKLQHVAQELGLGSKSQHDGFDLWLGCMKDDEKSWTTMKKYNKQDVVLTEKLYNRLLPWIKNHPHRGLYGGEKECCPRCGHDQLITRKYYTTRSGRYKTVQCKKCGGYSKGSKVEEKVDYTTV